MITLSYLTSALIDNHFSCRCCLLSCFLDIVADISGSCVSSFADCGLSHTCSILTGLQMNTNINFLLFRHLKFHLTSIMGADILDLVLGRVRDFSVNSSAMARNGFALVSVVVSCLHDKKTLLL